MRFRLLHPTQSMKISLPPQPSMRLYILVAISPAGL
jgi:hypothetical protein